MLWVRVMKYNCVELMETLCINRLYVILNYFAFTKLNNYYPFTLPTTFLHYKNISSIKSISITFNILRFVFVKR